MTNVPKIKTPAAHILRTMLCVGTLIFTSNVYSASGLDNASGVFERTRRYVVNVSSEGDGKNNKVGSGVIIGQNEVLSNCHVIDGASRFSIEFFDGERAQATLGRRVVNLDLCTLIVATGKRKPAIVAPLKSIKVGKKAYALGNPLSLSGTFSDGVISGMRKVDDRIVIQTTTPISPGSSGGGLFDSDGRLLGITTFSLVRGQSLNFALPAEYLETLEVSSINNRVARPLEPVTFKGVPFGSSIETFKGSFPGTVCRQRKALSICEGNAQYLGLWGRYIAGFQSDRMDSVSFYWKMSAGHSTSTGTAGTGATQTTSIGEVYDDIRAKLIEYFGHPSNPNYQWFGHSQAIEWSFGKIQSLTLGIEDCLNDRLFDIPCLIPGEPALLEVAIHDYRYFVNASPSKDF